MPGSMNTLIKNIERKLFNKDGDLTIDKIKNLEEEDNKYFKVPILELKVPLLSGSNKKVTQFSTEEDLPLDETEKIPIPYVFDFVTRDQTMSVEQLANVDVDIDDPPSETAPKEPTPGTSGLRKTKRPNKRKRSPTPSDEQNSTDDDGNNLPSKSAQMKPKHRSNRQQNTEQASKRRRTLTPPVDHNSNDDDTIIPP